MPVRVKKYHCVVVNCGKSYDRPSKLADHLRSHTGIRPFQCPICPSSFFQRKHLTVHELSHKQNDEKPFVCDQCGAGFTHKQQYDRHASVHVIEHLRCPHCPRSFVQRKSFENHVARHHVCEHCEKVLINESAYQNHISKHHSKRYRCGDCDTTLDSMADLHAHVRASHTGMAKGKAPSASVPPTLALVTGYQYDCRPLACLVEGCDKRFIREYDRLRHVSTAHRDNQLKLNS